MSTTRIIVGGGGITGLAAANRLLELSHERKRPLQLVLLDSSSRVGGTLNSVTRDGFLLERGPDSFISEKPEVVQLARRLNIESRLIETNSENRRSFIVRKGRLCPVPEGFHLLAPSRIFPFLTTDIFSFSGKARMAADLILPRKTANGNSDESLADFVRRRLGKEALARMAQPMVGGIYTSDPEKLSLRATFPRFLEMEARHRSIILALLKAGRSSTSSKSSGTSGARYSLFLTFDGGMQLLSDSLARRIVGSPETKVELRLNTAVESLTLESETNKPRWKIKTTANDVLTADAVCLALPAHKAATVVAGALPGVASELEAIPYASTATVNLAFQRKDISHPLNGFGFVVPYIEKRSLLACTFSSMKFPGRAPDGYALLRAFVGGALQPEMFALEEEEMVSRVLEDLGQLLGITTPPQFAEVSKWARSMPQYEVGHIDRVERISKELHNFPGLKVAGNAYGGAGIPDCIRSGETAAEELMEMIDSRTDLE